MLAVGSDAESEWRVARVGDNVFVVFDGLVTEAIGRASAAAFLHEMGDDSVHLVFDVRGVGGYESEARKSWQRALLPHRKRILSLAFVSNSQLTRMGALLFAKVLGIECRVVEDPSELDVGMS